MVSNGAWPAWVILNCVIAGYFMHPRRVMGALQVKGLLRGCNPRAAGHLAGMMMFFNTLFSKIYKMPAKLRTIVPVSVFPRISDII